MLSGKKFIWIFGYCIYMNKLSVSKIIVEAVEASTRVICSKEGLSKEDEETIKKVVNYLIALAYERKPTDLPEIDKLIEEAANVH